jgi:formate-dependent nitrite reductase membrane component NrfD
MYRGTVALYAGVGSLAVVLLGTVFGGAGTAHKAAVVGAGALIFGGLVMIGAAAPHLVRFGRRFTVPAFTCFVIAGIAGLIGVAEVIESFFLETAALEAWGKWAVRVAAGFAVLGALLLQRSQRSDGNRP